MDEICFTSTRFEPEASEFDSLAHAMAKAFGYTADLTIDRQLAELLRLRIAQVDPCSYCLILHHRAARDTGIHPDKIAHLGSWRESTAFSAHEAAALAYAEALTTFDHADFGRHHKRLRQLFTANEVAEIAAVVINMNVWTRWKLAQGSVPVLPRTDASPGAGSTTGPAA
jgi:AhpD family alkylhydroperoxidase